MIRVVPLVLAALLILGAGAPPRLISDLSHSKIDIVYSFAGAEVLVFGAIQYPGGRTPDERPDIAVIVRGPPEAITVRRKARVAGIWLNTRAVRFETAPSFYAVATTRPIAALVDDETAAIYELGLDHLQLSPASSEGAAEIREFEAGLLDLRRREGLYAEAAQGVELTENVLYRARVAIPSSVPVGTYTVEIHLIDDGEVVASTTRDISIDKSGFERDVYVAAQDHGVSYGVLAVSLALALGWIAGLFARR
jgi:uncharacterized protein (TIGR02186 family)